MCYSEFNDIIEHIAAMDADVITIETSRSQMELLDAFVDFKYPNEIGPGVYDIHSPRVPTTEEILALLNKALDVSTEKESVGKSGLWIEDEKVAGDGSCCAEYGSRSATIARAIAETIPV